MSISARLISNKSSTGVQEAMLVCINAIHQTHNKRTQQPSMRKRYLRWLVLLRTWRLLVGLARYSSRISTTDTTTSVKSSRFIRLAK